MSEIVAVCRACIEADRGIHELVKNVRETHPDGTAARWTLDCPECGTRGGFGMQLPIGRLDLGIVR